MAIPLLALVFAAIVIVLHAIRRDVSPLTRGISRYAAGWTLPAMTVGFVALGGALALVAWTERSWLFAVAAISIAGVAATPERLAPPHHSPAHTVCGFLFFASAAAAIYTSRASSPWPAAATLVFFLSLARVPVLARAPGAWQRLVFLAIVIWLLSCCRTRP